MGVKGLIIEPEGSDRQPHEEVDKRFLRDNSGYRQCVAWRPVGSLQAWLRLVPFLQLVLDIRYTSGRIL